MRHKQFSRIMLLSLCVLSVSCRSMLNYADRSPANAINTSAPGAVVSGYFVSKEKRHENDIVISGAFVHSAWTSFVPIIGLRYVWKGTLSFSGREQPFELVTWLTGSNSSGHSLNPVSLRGLPDSFYCKDFFVSSSRPTFSRPETYQRITEFELHGQKCYAEFLPKFRFQSMDDHFEKLRDKKQVIQIVDETGKRYADFDMNAYRIYEQPPETSIEELQMTLAVFSVVQHICLKFK